MKPVKKADLPTKTCLVCDRPFAWRKKWQRVWGEVKYCSRRCRNSKAGVTGYPVAYHSKQNK